MQAIVLYPPLSGWERPGGACAPNSGRGLTVPPDVVCISCNAYPTLAELMGQGAIFTAQIKHMSHQLVSVCNFTHPPTASSHGHTFKCLPLIARTGHNATISSWCLHPIMRLFQPAKLLGSILPAQPLCKLSSSRRLVYAHYLASYYTYSLFSIAEEIFSYYYMKGKPRQWWKTLKFYYIYLQ